ncbi:MAG: hypothetical protein FJ125_17940, partial [Deltaproteobacteria bacterium]|nr:hypothetical protein [Deltaproteobacteria bacterium]
MPDPRLLRLVGRFVRAQVLEGASSDLLELGVPQGSALSPLLSNVYLRPFDEAVLAAGYPLVRYADDLLVLCRTFEQTGEALDLLSRQVEALDLELGPKKTRRGNIGEGFVFLGVHFGPAGRGPARKALQALSERGQTILAEEQEPEAAAAALAGLLQRWEAYHGELAGPDHPGCALLLGSLAQLQPATTAAARLEELALARRRLAAAPLPAGTSPAPAWLHLALAEAWAAHGHADGLLLEAAAVLRAAGRRLDPAWRSRLLAALVVPERHAAAVLDALAHPPVGLAAALGQAGCTALADAVRQGLFAAGEEEEPGRPPRQGRLPEPAEQLVQRLAALFTGRAGVHAMLLKDRRGHLRLVPVERELEAEGWRAHLAGRRTLGLYPVRSDGTLRVGAAVFRLPRAALADAAQGSVLGAQLTDAACRLARAAEQLQLPCLIEEAGRRERRVWLLFAGPLAQRDARALLVRLSNEAGPVDPPLRLELLPATDRPGRAPGPLVTLPLAGRACGLEQARLLDVAGRALSDP